MKRILGALTLMGGFGLSVFAQDTVDSPPLDEAIAPVEDPSELDAPAAEDALNADAFEAPDQAEDPVEPVPGVDTLQERDLNARQPDVVEPADPGAAAAPGSTLPRDLPGDEAGPPIIVDPVDPAREPIEDQPLPEDRLLPQDPAPLQDPALSEPLPFEEGLPPAAPPRQRQPSEFDPAYGAPAPPRRDQPQVEIGDVVRNPIRIYDARLLVLMGHMDAATTALDTLGGRFPTDPRVPYLRFFMFSRTGQHDAALDALQQAVSLERLYPMTDYNRFMEPLQGPGRFYLERVRRATAELSSVDALVEPDPDELFPPAPERTVE